MINLRKLLTKKGEVDKRKVFRVLTGEQWRAGSRVLGFSGLPLELVCFRSPCSTRVGLGGLDSECPWKLVQMAQLFASLSLPQLFRRWCASSFAPRSGGHECQEAEGREWVGCGEGVGRKRETLGVVVLNFTSVSWCLFLPQLGCLIAPYSLGALWKFYSLGNLSSYSAISVMFSWGRAMSCYSFATFKIF